MKFKKTFILPVLVALPVFLFAHSGATGVIKDRMDLMSSLSKSVKTVSAMMKGKTEYDANIVQQEAKKISAISGKHITMLFPENSLDEISEAMPAIWQDWEEFERYAMELEVIAKGLVQAASNTENTAASANDVNSLLGIASSPGSTSSSANLALSIESLSSMPSRDVFKKLTQNCSGCHKNFRMDKD